ncbi:hypothetical protein, partial [uncultured Microbacterium sp.]|uniref:hypothetical protein n=1 Tax=uncultured Microbacterium sp. TaxID=191216 RepID=UPI0028EF1539
MVSPSIPTGRAGLDPGYAKSISRRKQLPASAPRGPISRVSTIFASGRKNAGSAPEYRDILTPPIETGGMPLNDPQVWTLIGIFV